MNTLEYINKNCKLNTDNTGTISVTMCVSLIKTVGHSAEENEETMRVKIRTSDVVAYLQSKGYSDIAIVTTGTIDNRHPKALTATWEFKAAKKKRASQKNRKTHTKNEK